METTVAEKPSINVFDYRKTARRRALICPGAGWEYLGRPMFGRLTFGAALAMLVVASLAAWNPAASTVWTAVGLLVATLVLIGIELFQTFIAWPNSAGAERPRATSRQPLIGAAVLTVAAVLLGTIIGTSFRTLRIDGDGMAPTALDGDRLLCRMGVDRKDLKAGTLILFSCSPQSKGTTVGDHMLARIIAGPGDELEIRDGFFVVNGKSGHPAGSIGPDLPALAVPIAPEPGRERGRLHTPVRVETDKYFVVQDSLTRGSDSRVLSWIELENIKSCRIFTFSRGFLPQSVE